MLKSCNPLEKTWRQKPFNYPPILSKERKGQQTFTSSKSVIEDNGSREQTVQVVQNKDPNTEFFRRVTEFTDDDADRYHRHYNKGLLEDPKEALTTLVITVVSEDKTSCCTEFVCLAGAIRTLENFTKDVDGMTICCKTMWMNNPSLKREIENDWKLDNQDQHSIAYRLINVSEDGEDFPVVDREQATLKVVQRQQPGKDHSMKYEIYASFDGRKDVKVLQFLPELIKV